MSDGGAERRDTAEQELVCALERVGTKRCPWQFECEAVDAPSRWLDWFAWRMSDEAVILAKMLLAERGEECTRESLNAAMGEAHDIWVANLRAAQDAGEGLPGCVLEAMEARRGESSFQR